MQKHEFFDAFLAESVAELEQKQARLEERFGLGHYGQYRADLETGTLRFLDENGHDRVRASVAPAGVHLTEKKIWQWLWSSQQLPEAIRQRAARLKELEAITDISIFGQNSFSADAGMADELIAMAVRYLGGRGMYRAPGRGMHYYFVIDDLELLDEHGKATATPAAEKVLWGPLSVKPASVRGRQLLATWAWLVPDGARLALITALGDLFLQTTDGAIHRLDAGWGKCYRVADNAEQFRALSKRHAEDWFHATLVEELRGSGMTLGADECYGYQRVPIFGGELQADNFVPTNLDVHHGILGQIHETVKDLPVGAEVKLRLDE